MSFFNPKIPLKQKDESHHPWEKRIKAKYSHKYKYSHNSTKNPIYPVKEDKFADEGRIKFTVIGNRITKEFIYCYYLVKGLHKYRQKQFDAPVIRGLTSVEWPNVLKDLKNQFGSLVLCSKSQVAVLLNGQFLGAEKELKELVESRYVYHLSLDYYKEGIQQFGKYIKSSGRPCAYFHISIDGVPSGTLIFMLYADIVPLTCENFLRLCELTKGGYGGTPVHRIVKDCWIQGGGFALKSTSLECENFIVPHDRRGVLCMANAGWHVDCSTQFFVLLQPAPWMASKYVAFGQLIEGEKTLSKIESVPAWNESPTAKIIIYKAGVFNMECHRIPINRNTYEYLDAHIEDLFAIAELFYEELLERVFLEIEFRYIKRLNAETEEEQDAAGEGGSSKNLHPTRRRPVPRGFTCDNATLTRMKPRGTTSYVHIKYHMQTPPTIFIIIKFMHKKEEIERHVAKSQVEDNHPGTSDSGSTTENNQFDVDVYEIEEYSYKQVTVETPSLVVKPVKPYYLSFVDVPYPGEVDSTFDLKKLLRGDYCLESDLQRRPISKKQLLEIQKPLDIPTEVLVSMFEEYVLEEEDSDVSSLDSDDNNAINRYCAQSADTVSYAGPVIKKMAHINQKFEILQGGKMQHKQKSYLSDEELRVIRLASKAHQEVQSRKKVSITISASKLSSAKIIRRQTGYIDPADIEKIHSLLRLSAQDLHDDDPDELYRKVRIAPTSLLHLPDDDDMQTQGERKSVLLRLFKDVSLGGDDNELPTLKGRSSRVEQEDQYVLLTNSAMDYFHTSREKILTRRSRNIPDSIEHVLQLQHGHKIHRKISSDYVRTIDRIEQKFQNSIRSVEYSKKRPSMSVTQYKLRNKKYQTLKSTKDKPGAVAFGSEGLLGSVNESKLHSSLKHPNH